GNAPTHGDGDPCLQVVERVVVLVSLRQLHGHAQRHSAWDDGDLVQRIGARHQRGYDGVARLVVGRDLLLFVGQQHAFALGANQDLVLGQLKVVHEHGLPVIPGGIESCLVHHVGELGAGETRRAARQDGKIHVVRQRNLAGMHTQNLFASTDVRKRNHNTAIEAAGPQQRRIKNVRAVGGGDQDHAFVGLKAVHLHQQLVQSLLALVVPAAQACAAMTAHGVNFVDEDNAWSVLLALLKQVANPAGAHAYEHLDKVRTGDAEEGYV